MGGEDEESISDGEEMIVLKLKLSILIRRCFKIDYSSYRQLPEMAQHHYQNLRMVREFIIREQLIGGGQTKM